MIIASFPKGSFPANSWPVGTWLAAPAVVDIQYTEVMEFSLAIATEVNFEVELPNAAIAMGEWEAATADMVVSGAGTEAANGVYAYLGMFFGKPLYSKGDGYNILYSWTDHYWTIYLATAVGDYYTSTEDVARPDLVTNWVVGDAGILPLPTVTKIATLIPTLTQIVDMYLPMPMIIDFELYEELSA